MPICDNCKPLKSWLPDGQVLQGSITDLLSNPTCKFCQLIMHLLTPLDSKALISWSKEKPRELLEQHRFFVSSTAPYEATVQRSYPNSQSWYHAGIIRPLRETDLAQNDEDSPISKLDLTMHERDIIKVFRTSGLSRHSLIRQFEKLKGNHVNFSSMQYLLKQCDSYHTTCRQRMEDEGSNLPIRPIRLVDVRDDRIVQSNTAQKYFALSYVWGQSQILQANTSNIDHLEVAGSLKSQNSESSLPRTIRDAMQFVRKMNVRYLWVDALCRHVATPSMTVSNSAVLGIVQDDPAEKHSQISQMHEIYKAAYATIVQASGYNADGGLPGVRSGSRSMMVADVKLDSKGDSNDSPSPHGSSRHSSFSINISPRSSVPDSDEMSFVAVPEFDSSTLLHNTVHSTRGWTLQETLLSRRCIYFFEKQAMFVCAEDIYQDCFTRPRPNGANYLTNEDIRSAKELLPWQMNPMQPFHGRLLLQSLWLEHFESYARIVTNYNRRQLSYGADVLSAFSGLAEGLAERAKTSMHFGMPSSSFDLALLWIPTKHLNRKRENFREAGGKLLPSWSWASWDGEITYNLCATSGLPSQIFTQVSSYVKSFQLQDVSKTTHLDRQSWPPHGWERKPGSALHKAYEAAEDPSNIPKSAIQCPIGCLSFWSEEVVPESIQCKAEDLIGNENGSTSTDANVFVFLYDKLSNKRIGILGLPATYELPNSNADKNSEYTYVLLSECVNLFEEWPTYNGNGLAKVDAKQIYGDVNDDHATLQYFLNVLFIRRCDTFVERVAFGQIYLGSWVKLKRRRRYFRMI
jgi:Heterokaryon incompatibility protein (HET)